MRYQGLLNGALSLAVEECGELVIIREVVIAGSAHQPTRQRVELALGVMVQLIRQLLKTDWQPRRVCFEHPAPHDANTHQRFFGSCVEFDYDFNCIICAKSDLDARNPSADPAMARYAQQLLDASVTRQATVARMCGARSCCCCQVDAVASNRWPNTSAWYAARSSAGWRNRGRASRRSSTTFARNSARVMSSGDRPLTEVATYSAFRAERILPLVRHRGRLQRQEAGARVMRWSP